MMENYLIENDINVICVQANSFPNGVMAAYDKLHQLLNGVSGRTIYGISYGDGPGNIIYKAAATENFPDEAAQLGCESFTIRKGIYYGTVIKDFMNDIPAIDKTFHQLLEHPKLAPDGYCLEIYEGDKDVRCLIPLINQ